MSVEFIGYIGHTARFSPLSRSGPRGDVIATCPLLIIEPADPEGLADWNRP